MMKKIQQINQSKRSLKFLIMISNLKLKTTKAKNLKKVQKRHKIALKTKQANTKLNRKNSAHS